MSEKKPDIKAEINYHLFKKVRLSKKMSLASASAGIIDEEELRKAEDGESKISWEAFQQIAHRYGTNINYFFLTDEGAKASDKFWKKTNRHMKIINFIIKKWHLEGEVENTYRSDEEI
jgi:hypothetical protein